MTLNRFFMGTGAAALAVVALAACGSGRGGERQRNTVHAVDARAAVPGPGPDAQVAFMEMLERVGAPCVPDAPAVTETDVPDPAERPPTRPSGPLPVDEKPPTDVPSPTAAPERPTLNGVEACEGRAHGERVLRALTGLNRPTATQVRRKLNELGYTDFRVHGLKARRGVVRFWLDLRVMGGQLALEGTVAGKETTVKAFAHPAEGVFRPGR
ncbi:hypothetical protein [Streptomyces echinatus]|uniref:Lipoprotein n=1 Tax=Streptomyces echinatus TaxID=67293 RepID=A0A7W9UV57_9ACTN|nr:hypothetical protein [Streptomyces echinatus]MBB5932237.1 hypothetical protein [Streptomyces echinatus]